MPHQERLTTRGVIEDIRQQPLAGEFDLEALFEAAQQSTARQQEVGDFRLEQAGRTGRLSPAQRALLITRFRGALSRGLIQARTRARLQRAGAVQR